MNYIIEGSQDDAVGSVEHQFYPVPFVGVTDAKHLWSATMDGEYPEFRGENPNVAKYWFDFMSDTRHWELEPYFDVDGTRAVALEDVEYVNYIEHPAGTSRGVGGEARVRCPVDESGDGRIARTKEIQG